MTVPVVLTEDLTKFYAQHLGSTGWIRVLGTDPRTGGASLRRRLSEPASA